MTTNEITSETRELIVELLGDSMPGADIIEVGDHGFRRTPWDDLDLVFHWRRFLGDPQAYLRHVID